MKFMRRLYDPEGAPGVPPPEVPPVVPGAEGARNAGEGTPPVVPPVVPPETPPAFAVPDAYREKGWAGKVKSLDDVYKQLDNLDGAVGKKYPKFDHAKATDQEREEYLASQRPETAEAYDFFDESISAEEKTFTQKMFYDEGISVEAAKRMTEKFRTNQQAAMASDVSAEGLKAEMVSSFGEDYEKQAGHAAALLKSLVSKPEDQVLIDQGINNKYLGLFYRVMDAVKTKYGVEEKDLSIGNPPGGLPAGDKDAQRTEIRNKITALSKRTHTAAEKQTLLDQLSATYK